MTVSILIPAYNAAETLPRALDSLMAQTRQADEILVCDDGSTDRTAEVVSRYPAVRLVPQEHGGLSRARNTLLDASTKDVIIFCDADDALKPDWIKVLVGRLEETGADLSVCGLFSGIKLDEKRYTWPCEGEGVIDGSEYYAMQLRHPVGVFSYLPIVAMRRAMLFEKPVVRGVIGLQAHEDEAFLLQVAKRAGKVAYTDKCLYDYIYAPQSLCAVYMRRIRATARLRRQWYLKDWSKYRTSGKPIFAIKAMRNYLLMHLRHFILREPVK